MNYGNMNAHVVGTLMKEAVRRAMVAIRGHRFTFEATAKAVGADGKEDFVTTADQAAQQVFVKLLRDWFPEYGIVAEEGSLTVPCTARDHESWFTVDPLDGTKAFMRRQSHGIGTMIALVRNGEVVGACVGDVMTQEVYVARPGGDSCHRISEFGIAEVLEPGDVFAAGRQWILLRERVTAYPPVIQAMLDSADPLFSDVVTTRGSIGIAMARLWKGEVGAAVFGPLPRCSPWDLYPIVALCDRLGYVFLAVRPDGSLVPWVPKISKLGLGVPDPILVIHSTRLPDVRSWHERRSG